MNYDYGSRDPEFMRIIRSVIEKVLRIQKVSKGEYEVILMQGSGSFGIEATM